MIPKTIHYCWFGEKKKSVLIEECIASWHAYLPDFEIKEWNESNFDIMQNAYSRQAYKDKMWAYVSDYARMKILYENGGIYLDTDVELLKPLPEELLQMNCFTGIEEFSCLVNPGLIFGCNPHDWIVEKILESYENDTFRKTKTDEMITINIRISRILDNYGYIHEDKRQNVAGIDIFPSEVFCGYDGKRRRFNITENTISVHHYAASWLPWYRKIKLKFGTLLRRWIYRFD